jgi:outer membrane protein OmpA-like peptidoglycan-associated protein
MIRLVVALLLLTGCAGTALRDRLGKVGREIKTAQRNGAMRCAPIELAMAESHFDFARQELDEGNYVDARRQVEIAETNARAAVSLSPRERCNPPREAATPADSDGDGISDSVDECPRKPEDKDQFEDDDGCPEDDNDGDGVLDVVDRCPLEPEDRDGFQDQDGCPELDNDQDQLIDSQDGCPNDPEDKDGFEDKDGCPDCDNDKDGVVECPEALDRCPGEAGPKPDGCPQKYTMVVVTEKKIELKQTVYFDTRRATIKRVSYPLLDEVAQAMSDLPRVRVRIEGHTDSQGSDSFNLKLSRQRAAAVRTYLVRQGIDGDRMVAEGYGESMPLADNRSGAGREQNRRVEFVITSR